LGVLGRLILSDAQWERIIGDERTRGLSGRDNRMFVEAVLWIVRTGSPQRELPELFRCLERHLSPVQPLKRQALAPHLRRDVG
jgi:transposase